MAILYFNDDPAIGGAGDSDWDTIDNWWSDAACETQASGLPTSSDSVELVSQSSAVLANSGSEPTVVNVNMPETELGMSITVTGLAVLKNVYNATLTGDAVLLDIIGGIVTGDATISGAIVVGTVGGTATFTDATGNGGLIDGQVGNAYFYNNSQNGYSGSVTGNAYFYDESYSVSGSTVGGDAEYNDESSNTAGDVTGTATFNDDSQSFGGAYGTAVFNDRSNSYGVLNTSNEVTFNDYSLASQDSGTMWPTVVFNDMSTCNGFCYDSGIYINGAPIVMPNLFNDVDQHLYFIRRSGINGSSILGVV